MIRHHDTFIINIMEGGKEKEREDEEDLEANLLRPVKGKAGQQDVQRVTGGKETGLEDASPMTLKFMMMMMIILCSLVSYRSSNSLFLLQ